MKNFFEISKTEFYYLKDGSVAVFFKNEITGASEMKTYKSESMAKRESSKFHSRMNRVYNCRVGGIEKIS